MDIGEHVTVAVAASLAGTSLSPEEIAVRAIDLGKAVSREVRLRETALYAGKVGEDARRELGARKGIGRETP